MNRYLLFAGSQYYPSRGWRDFIASFETKAEAVHEAAKGGEDWWQIVDLDTESVVDEGTRS